MDTRELAARTAFWQPQLLLSGADPYPSLYVEVDAVEGSAPDAGSLEDLRAFLAASVDKPGGIRVEVDDIIPREAARGRNSRSLALEFIDGPPDPDSALIHLFYFDSRTLSDRKSQPATTLLPYPVSIFIDTAYRFMDTAGAGDSRSGPGEFRNLALRHEAGHVLGLCRGASHGDGLHCADEHCLMNARIAFHVSRYVTRRDPWKQRDLCSACQAELQAYRAATPAANLRFRGPYLVRSEPAYHVLSLPGFVYIQLGPLEALDPGRLRTGREYAVHNNRQGQVAYASSVISQADARAVIPALLQDPLDLVRDLGRDLQGKLQAERIPTSPPPPAVPSTSR
jgi:hypothetical protein